MLIRLPPISDFIDSRWELVQPSYQNLLDQPINDRNVTDWLTTWSELRKLVDETYARLQLANALDTTDVEAEKRFYTFLNEAYPQIQAFDQRLKEKFLASDLAPDGMEVPLHRMRAEADLFREENLPLITQERMLGSAYNKILGAQTVEWWGEQITLVQLRARTQTPDRGVRQRAWQLASERQLADREAINDLWVQVLGVRRQMAANANLPDYRAYRWWQLYRFDYSPEDCRQFREAIEQVVVPATHRIYEKHRQRLGVDKLRPWDLQNERETMRFPPLRAYESVEQFETVAGVIFQRVDPQLGAYFETMRKRDLLDLENRAGKGAGGFCTSFATQGVPFIFMNAVGLETDVRTLLHEAGHAFHVFERTLLPYHHQWRPGVEFAEVASTAMEFLTAPYLPAGQGGFFNDADAARFRLQHLENKILFWPYMAVVDAFQDWVYTHPDAAENPANCDAQWGELIERFIPAVDWSGLQDAKLTGWQRKLHIHRYPFYYIEYGLALLGAVQVWANALQDQAKAVADYRTALALGTTVSIPELYAAAGAKFAFDAGTLGEAVVLMESTMAELEAIS
jgi:oligoendopeptidase F